MPNDEKLASAMYVMVMAYRSGCLKFEMEKGLAAIREKQKRIIMKKNKKRGVSATLQNILLME